jgi:hypothetical protein
LVIIDLIASFPWAGLGFGGNSFISIMTSVFVGILNLIVVVQVILIEKSRLKRSEKESLLYAAPTYLIYTIYYSLLVLLGVVCFIIPGIILAVVLSMVPIATILIDDEKVNFFKISYQMTKKNPSLIITFVITSVFLELISAAFEFIGNWQIKLGVDIAYSFVDAFLLIIVTMASVKTFYYLKNFSLEKNVV